MDRGEQALPAVQPNVPAAVEGSQQQPQAPPAGQASGSQQPQQANQSQPQQRSPESTQAGPLVAIRLPPPTPAKTERDLTFRASRPVSRSISPPTDGYEDASDARVESPQPQPIRLSSVPLIQSPEVARSRDGGHGSRGNLVYDIPPAGIPPPGNPPRRRRGSAAMDWVIPDREVASVYIVRNPPPVSCREFAKCAIAPPPNGWRAPAAHPRPCSPRKSQIRKKRYPRVTTPTPLCTRS